MKSKSDAKARHLDCEHSKMFKKEKKMEKEGQNQSGTGYKDLTFLDCVQHKGPIPDQLGVLILSLFDYCAIWEGRVTHHLCLLAVK